MSLFVMPLWFVFTDKIDRCHLTFNIAIICCALYLVCVSVWLHVSIIMFPNPLIIDNIIILDISWIIRIYSVCHAPMVCFH